MTDHSRDDSTLPGQKCDVCGAPNLVQLYQTQRRSWVGDKWVTTHYAICCSPLCLFGAAMNPADHFTPVDTE